MQFSLNTLRYEDIRQQIVDFLTERQLPEGKFDFAGSNISYVIDSMAYTAMLLSYYTSNVANNIFLDTTEVRKNAVSIAKTLGYRPLRKQSSQKKIVFNYYGSGFNNSHSITLEPKLSFEGGTTKFPFTNLEKIELKTPRNSNNETIDSTVLTAEVILRQGEFKNFLSYGTGESLQSFILPTLNAAEENFTIYVYTSGDNNGVNASNLWNEVKTFYEISLGNNNIFFTEEDISQEYYTKILFGNGIIGNIPTLSQTINVEYFETQGTLGNGEDDIKLISVLSDVENINISYNLPSPINLSFINGAEEIDGKSFLNIRADLPSYGGRDSETLLEIQQNAPKYFSVAGRGVTRNDLLSVFESFNIADKVNVIGGDELFPGRSEFLGNSYLVGIPALPTNFQKAFKIYLSETEEREVIERMKTVGIISTKKYFVKPTYIYLDTNVAIEFPQNALASDKITTMANVRTNVDTYVNENLDEIGSKYRQSKIQSVVEITPGVVSSSISTDFYFPLTYDFFYFSNENRMWLPTIFVTANGEYVYNNVTGAIETNSFIKRNKDIVDNKPIDTRVNSTGELYTYENLPPNESTIYSKDGLSHKYMKRWLYNSDYVQLESLNLSVIGTGESSSISVTNFPLTNEDGSKSYFTLIDNGTVAPNHNYLLYLDTLNVGTLSYNYEEKTINISIIANSESDPKNSDLEDAGFYNVGTILEPEYFIITPQVNNTKFLIESVKIGSESNLKIYGKTPIIEFILSLDAEGNTIISPTIVAYPNLITTFTDITDENNIKYKVSINDANDNPIEFGTMTFDPTWTYGGNFSASSNASFTYYKITGYGNVKQWISEDDDTLTENLWCVPGDYVLVENRIVGEETLTGYSKYDPFSFEYYSEEYISILDLLGAGILPATDIQNMGVLTLVDRYHDSIIGRFTYKTGEALFFETIETIDGTEQKSIRDYFNNYTLDKTMDLINMVPADTVSGDIITGSLVDFDTRFNQKIIFYLQPLTIKTV